MKRTKKEQKARGKKYGESIKSRNPFSSKQLGFMSASLLSKFNEKFG